MTGLWWEKHLGEETRFGFNDSETYWVLGQAIAEGKPYQFGTPELRCMRTPGYPVILAAIFRATAHQPSLFYRRNVKKSKSQKVEESNRISGLFDSFTF
jgi:hypothetical protein